MEKWKPQRASHFSTPPTATDLLTHPLRYTNNLAGSKHRARQVAVGLWPVAIFLPHHLIKIGHHPPVGTYIAIMGGLAALVSLRKEPSPIEKAVWIFLIALVMIAEIRNLYISDKQQTETFATINGDLTKTGQEMDKTLQGLTVEDGKLGKISDHIDGVAKSSEEAASAAKDGVLELTGADSFMMIYPHGELLNGKPVEGKFDLLNVANGKHPVWDGRIFMKEGSLSDPENLYRPYQEYDLKPVMPVNLAGFGRSIQPPKTGVTSYNFGVSSRRPLTEEELDVRFNAKGNRWEYKYAIWEPQPFTTTPKPWVLLKKMDWSPIPYPRIIGQK